jgi:DNA-directed RNA polymerase subunit omega
LNSELTRKALEKVGNPNVLVNLVSRRVRQLNGLSGGSPAHPLISETVGLGAADIALLEIADGKLGWDMLDDEGQVRTDDQPKGKESKASKSSK